MMRDSNNWMNRRRFIGSASALVSMGALGGCLGNQEDNETKRDLSEVTDDEWREVDEFYFEGRASDWRGVRPSFIEGIRNPTLVLFEGQEYDFGWVNKDGVVHDIQIRNDDNEIVDDYASEETEERGAEIYLRDVVATPGMARYICRFHRATMNGEIEVREKQEEDGN